MLKFQLIKFIFWAILKISISNGFSFENTTIIPNKVQEGDDVIFYCKLKESYAMKFEVLPQFHFCAFSFSHGNKSNVNKFQCYFFSHLYKENWVKFFKDFKNSGLNK